MTRSFIVSLRLKLLPAEYLSQQDRRRRFLLEARALNGLELQKLIGSDRADIPIIFTTGHGDVPMSVQAMKAGAVEFLTKPFDDDVLPGLLQWQSRVRPPRPWATPIPPSCGCAGKY